MTKSQLFQGSVFFIKCYSENGFTFKFYFNLHNVRQYADTNFFLEEHGLYYQWMWFSPQDAW